MNEKPSYSLDADSLIYDMNRSLNPLFSEDLIQFQVEQVRNGYALVSLVLPQGMLRAYSSLLESLTAFFRFMDRKVKLEKVQERNLDPEKLEHERDLQEEFDRAVCSTFDQMRAEGYGIHEAVKRTNGLLKEKGHPWATFFVVENVLRAAGKLRRKNVAGNEKEKG